MAGLVPGWHLGLVALGACVAFGKHSSSFISSNISLAWSNWPQSQKYLSLSGVSELCSAS